MDVEHNLRGLRDSLVVGDSSALDSVKMTEGLDFLWDDLSIATLASLDDMLAGRKPAHVVTDKITFLFSGFLPDYEPKIKEILSSGSYTECTVLSGVSEGMLVKLGKCAEGYFAELIGRIKDWLRQGQAETETKAGKKIRLAKASIVHSQLLLSPLGEDNLFFPSCSGLFPAFYDEGEVPEFADLIKDAQRNIELLSAGLLDMLSQRNLHTHFFSLGRTSDIIGKKLAELHQQPSQPEFHASLLLIDRTLDMVAPCMHSDNLMDQVYSTIPRKSPFSLDLSVKVDSILGKALEPETLFPDISGTLGTASHHSEEVKKLQHALMTENSRGALTAVKKTLVDIAARERLAMKAPKGLGKITLQQLTDMLEAFPTSGPSFFKHLPILQHVAAVVQTMKKREEEKWEELMGVEKMLAANLAEGESVLEQLVELVQGQDSSRFTLNQILILGIYCYSLLGNEFEQEVQGEQKFRAAVELLLSKADGSQEVTLAAKEKASHIFEKLHQTRKARQHLQRHRSLINKEAEAPYTPLLVQVVDSIFTDTAPPEHGDIVHHPPPESAQKSFLSGFSHYLTKAMKSRPDGSSVLIIIVVGGITFNEIREVRELIGKHDNEKTLIGSTDIISAKEIYNNVFL